MDFMRSPDTRNFKELMRDCLHRNGMKQEIRQNGKTVLYSEDGCSIPMIFNNLVGKNLKGREYSDYIAFVAIPDMGFTYGKIAYYSDGNLIATGEIKP